MKILKLYMRLDEQNEYYNSQNYRDLFCHLLSSIIIAK